MAGAVLGASRIMDTDAMIAAKLSALIRKHHPSLMNTSNMPAMDGPIKRPLFISTEFRAIAFGRSAREFTIWLIRDCRAGVSKAMIAP